MRRSHSGGYAYGPLPSTSHDALEEENERIADELKDKISLLKAVSIDIGTEVKYQEKMLNGMDEDFERTSGSLTSSVSRVLRMARAGHNYYIIYLFLFSIAVFIVLWLVLKFK
ncbi:BET1 homolog [Neodiprion pinetum]|uniref:BET1-like protein n=1 Tax=Neodiprion lecontei TaxID=441921 RepID=A0A6J0BH35_NEOLC|nr:BET1-like protein [Neodiprion lecontei]XP_046427633.1 BET1-like protein [Neodiprion fabricii]XP_046427634.1 BET1-like protein [Neodiprion fabricii]XP_046427635.1 BET1-like protein [Neodiprion fabricii]XP_046484455.1 BET1-like protein [Neodiprion pinetum]XP_046484456.1 BET1-like protein [Neodiprion pinetum]XP_046484457.1 BET1-like protein [Neodiprion pinetum]XP_046597422.1 BET1-like protein [Neodiprion lecontei]XP_046597423.1 BET1-like protein [Neodiprion lecontei]XP_046621673.1 BET1-lik